MAAIDSDVSRSKLALRWVVLPLSCFLMLGNYYVYDTPSALSSQLKQYFQDSNFGGDHWQTYFALLYSVYSFPNIVLPFFGGYLVDYVGVRIMLIVFCALIMAGQAVVAIGASIGSIPVMLAGRVLFGFGGESLTVAQSALVSVWFQDKELAFAMGVNLSVARLGGVINNVLSPIWWRHGHFSFWFGLIVCGFSLLCCLLLTPIDKYAERIIARLNPSKAVIRVDEKISIKDVRHFSLYFWLLTLSCVVVYGCVLPFNNVAGQFLQKRDFIGSGPWTNNISYIVPAECDADCSSYTTLAACEPLGVNGSSVNSCTWTGAACETEEYCSALLDAENKANYVMSIPYIISSVISPFLGFGVDKLGGRAVLATLAPLVLIAVHIMLGFTHITPYVPLIGQGLAYSVFAAALWPSVPYAVDERYVGTAYGLLTAVQNGGMALFPFIVGQILAKCNNDPSSSVPLEKDLYDACQDSLDQFKYTELFFVSLAAFGSLVGVVLNFWDARNGWRLNSRHSKAKAAAAPEDETKPLLTNN